jgi:murein DD-endopeptidase MepM/ murein hydrolase activator NlpD
VARFSKRLFRLCLQPIPDKIFDMIRPYARYFRIHFLLITSLLMAALLMTALLVAACSHNQTSPYENADKLHTRHFKQVRVPLLPGTPFFISQGAFGKFTHSAPGNEYNWDFDVPYGTSVTAVDDGVVLDLWEPPGTGGCNSHLCDTAHNLKIENKDGSVSQYTHIKSFVHQGQHVRKGAVIAVTDKNGCICAPQLHFGIYRSDKELENSPDRRTLPLLFSGLGDGILRSQKKYVTPPLSR